MKFGDDGRAQSTLVGAILLFAILIVAFSSYQAVVVPNQNSEVEFNHNTDTQSDMQDLRNSILDVRSVKKVDDSYEIVSEHRSVKVQLGTNYPSRLIALNPPRPSGTIQTVDPESNVTITNAKIANAGEFDEDPSPILDEHSTTFLSYEPNYNEYQDAPETRIEHSLLYNEFEGANTTVADQTVVSNNSNRITVVLYEGDFSYSSSRARSLNPRTVDGPTDWVEIEPESGDTIQLTLPTNSRERWEESLQEIDHASLGGGGDSEQVEIDLDTSKLDEDVYKLRVARVNFERDTGRKQKFTPIQTTSGSGNQNGIGTGGGFESVTTTISEQGNKVDAVTFDWSMSQAAAMRLRIYDENDNVVGDEFIFADPDESKRVDIKNSLDNNDERQDYPVRLEIKTGDNSCEMTVDQTDGTGPFRIC